MIRAIIFDMDGVICDSEPLHLRAFQQTLKDHGISLTDQEYYDRYLAFDDRGCFTTVLQSNGQNADEVTLKEWMDAKSRYFDQAMKTELRIYPGAAEFVKKASARYPIALASGARRLEVEFVLKKAGIRGCFTAVVSADDVVHGKPHPESFQRALTLLNERRLDGSVPIAPAECVVIEDSKHGIAAARSAGMKVVALTTSYPAEQLSGADRVVPHLMGLSLESLESLS